MTHAWFVTGTDTGVGKTRACAALLHALRARHPRCVGMKPVAAGADDAGLNEDVLALRAASTLAVPPALPVSYVVRPDGTVVRVDPPTPFRSADEVAAAIERLR